MTETTSNWWITSVSIFISDKKRDIKLNDKTYQKLQIWQTFVSKLSGNACNFTATSYHRLPFGKSIKLMQGCHFPRYRLEVTERNE